MFSCFFYSEDRASLAVFLYYLCIVSTFYHNLVYEQLLRGVKDNCLQNNTLQKSAHRDVHFQISHEIFLFFFYS